jgi:hypothetical protein
MKCSERRENAAASRGDNFSPRADHAAKKFFRAPRNPQPQRNHAVRAPWRREIDNLSQHLAEPPLTAVLAGVKSATQLFECRAVIARKEHAQSIGWKKVTKKSGAVEVEFAASLVDH